MNFLTALFNAVLGFIRRNPLLCLIIVILAVGAPAVLKGIAVFILYFILGLVVLGVVGVLFFRWRIYRLQKQMGEQFGTQDNFNDNPFKRRENTSHEGEIKVYKTPDTPEKRVSGDVGDYIEFEETKEK